MKAAGVSEDVQVVDRFEGGVGWIAHPEEAMQRASHALATDDGVWVVDPVDGENLDDVLADLGDVAGVAVLLDRHRRDAAAVAKRHDVAVHVPPWFDTSIDAPTEHLTDGPGAYDLVRLKDSFYWNEAGLWDGKTLLVPESVGTVDFFRAGDERLGVHPALRLFPPKKLRRFDPERVLVGHGEGVHEEATAALHDAIRNSRKRAPQLYAKSLKAFLG